MSESFSFEHLRAELDKRRLDDEVISTLDPRALGQGAWWGDRPWRPEFRAGLLESKRGYRFRPENLALAHLLHGRGFARVVDLGAGTGSLALLALYTTGARVVALERQPEQAERLTRTAEAHGEPRLHVLEGDLRDEAVLDELKDILGGRPDLVVANPPFFPPNWGRESKNTETHQSTHALHGNVDAFVAAGAALLTEDGRMMVVYDALRLHEVVVAAGRAGLGIVHVSWLPDTRPEHEDEPFRVWVELGRGGAEVSRL